MSETRDFDAMIGRGDRWISEFLLVARSGNLDAADIATIKHHAHDLIGAGRAALDAVREKPSAGEAKQRVTDMLSSAAPSVCTPGGMLHGNLELAWLPAAGQSVRVVWRASLMAPHVGDVIRWVGKRDTSANGEPCLLHTRSGNFMRVVPA